WSTVVSSGTMVSCSHLCACYSCLLLQTQVSWLPSDSSDRSLIGSQSGSGLGQFDGVRQDGLQLDPLDFASTNQRLTPLIGSSGAQGVSITLWVRHLESGVLPTTNDGVTPILKWGNDHGITTLQLGTSAPLGTSRY